jgi:DNA-binding IclR family transcriptional regulator
MNIFLNFTSTLLKYMVQVLIKALDILELIAQADGQALTLTEISYTLNMSQPTASNIINTMISKGYIEHVGKKKGYKLGPSSFKLTNVVAYEQELVDASKGVKDDLTNKLNETSLLGILRNQKRLILYVANSSHDIQVQVKSERNVYETASGRLLLAYLNEGELKRFLQQNGLPDASMWVEAADEKGLSETIFKIKERAFVNTFLPERGVMGFAVPIFKNNNVIAALSIFLPEYRCSKSKEQEIIKSLKSASFEISQKLSSTH